MVPRKKPPHIRLKTGRIVLQFLLSCSANRSDYGSRKCKGRRPSSLRGAAACLAPGNLSRVQPRAAALCECESWFFGFLTNIRLMKSELEGDMHVRDCHVCICVSSLISNQIISVKVREKVSLENVFVRSRIKELCSKRISPHYIFSLAQGS